jgi:hypothetical protein
MNIQQRLLSMAADLEAQEGFVSETVDVCRQAAGRIDQLELRLERLNTTRFDLFFAAALQGILARNSGDSLLHDKAQFVGDARRLAGLCMDEDR